MAKKITRITLNNYRAYFGEYEINLKNGENLLIYGENGSGKSSLYKSINQYFSSSVSSNVRYVRNRYNEASEGRVCIEFHDFDTPSITVIPGTGLEACFSTSVSDHAGQAFIKDAALTKGFLDYTDLLKIYLHSKPDPNLYDFVVSNLLANHIPLSSGGNFKFGTEWKKLRRDLLTVYHRGDSSHRAALAQLPIFETHLRHSLSEIFVELNRMLLIYFQDLNIELDYHLENIQFTYGSTKKLWSINTDFRLLIKRDGILVGTNYNDFLNEARLSAFSVCLYLASLKLNPTQLDFKILYLDDIFIGLDAGNRLPILNILLNEFRDYQMFVSTYDRHWFELSKRFFEDRDGSRWLTSEFYVGNDSVDNQHFSVPIVLTGKSNYEKAIKYLHNRTNPDYPAAANYFRKSLEELIQKHIPKWELVDGEYAQIPSYKITKLLAQTKKFLERTNHAVLELTIVNDLIQPLLHPLSHHDTSSQIYKRELVELELGISRLEQHLKAIDISNNYKCCLEKGCQLRIEFLYSNAPQDAGYYEIILSDNLILKKNGTDSPLLIDCGCKVTRLYQMSNGAVVTQRTISKTNTTFRYNSLSNAYTQISQHLVTDGYQIIISTMYTDVISVLEGENWKAMNDFMVWS